MEHQLFKAIVAVLAALGKPRFNPRATFTDRDIVTTFYWAVIRDRPTTWALDRRHWPPPLRRGRRLPAASTMSERLRTPAVRDLLTAVERRVTAPAAPGLYWMIDGKPLPIGGCSKDRQAGYGRAAGCKAKGYKLHAIVAPDGAIADWRVAPMNKDEREMAARLLNGDVAIYGYLVADANYDSNPLHALCDRRGDLQLVTRRRHGPGRGTGHRPQTAGRRRCIELLENPAPAFGADLLRGRAAVERAFGNLTNWGGGLTVLPPWVRTHRRVHRWVQAKLALAALKRQLPERTCAA